jgi:hypothetical protein
VVKGDKDQAGRDIFAQRDFLLACATWQDGLLQSYRSLSLTVSSILIAVGVGSVVAAIEQSRTAYSLGFSFFVLLLAIFSVIFAEKFQEVILSRGRDIDFWHKAVIRAENSFDDADRSFTHFKLVQKNIRKMKGSTHSVEPLGVLTDEEIDSLIGSGLGHTRRFVDRSIVLGIRLLWAVIGLGAVWNIVLRVA